MNQSYPLPPNNSSPDSETADWFAHIDTPDAPIEPDRHSHKKPLLLIAGLLCVVIAAATASAAWYYLRPTCLTASDYEALTTSSYGDTLSPKEDFITLSPSFVLSSTNMSEQSKKEFDAFAKRLQSFTQAKPNASANFTIRSDYIDGESKEVARSRAQMITAQLTRAGVSSEDIRATEPTLIEPESDAVVIPFVAISLTSADECR